MTRLWKIPVLVSLLCSGCTIGPRYQRPVAQTPAALKEMAGNDQWKMAAPGDSLPKGKWWEIFGDPELNRLEELVNINNQNVKVAEAQFRQARATVLANHANYYPTIGSNPSISQSYVEKKANHSFSLPAVATWEPDLWGRVRTTVQSAVSSAQVSAADLENIRLSQQALLATDYFLLAAQDMQLKVLSGTIETYEKNLQLTVNRHAGGVASRSDITLAQTQLAAAKAQSAEMRIARAQDEHAIAMLTGQQPASLEIGVSTIGGPPPPIPVGVPSQLLERRPDIAASERQVATANSNIGLAETAYYPTLTLSASPGFISSSLVNLFTYASRSWSAGPSLSQTLFDFGRRGAAVEGAQAAYDATVASYRQTVLSAFQEVEDDLADLRYLAEEAVREQEAVVAAQEALGLEMDRYRAGTDSYLNVITTQIILLGDEQTAITILQRRMSAAVDLIKALGGGWDASTLPSVNVLRSSALDPKSTPNAAPASSK
ncbi:MAG TPA: efflux transporter outer membrane subunit [Bryobacteraceae bacterium]|nr:efflux transporter outer membrane subunit [Bryobacteraceae bacterium]